MACLERAVAALRIFGDTLVPEEITAMLGAEPTTAYSKGTQSTSAASGRIVVRKSGRWSLNAEDREPDDFDAQVMELLGQLTANPSVWSELTRRFEIDLFCGWFMGSSNEGVEISPEVLMALGSRGIHLSLDIYGPDGD